MKVKKTKRSGRNLKQKNTLLMVGSILAGFMVLLIVISFFWTPYNTTTMDAASKFSPPTLAHIMGCDSYGRDIFSRILEGAGTSFLIAVCVVAIGTVAGILIGALTGYFGGWADEILMRICDSITAFPAILLALVIVAVVGRQQGDDHLDSGTPFYSQLCPYCAGRVRKSQRIELCQKCPAHGRQLLPDHVPAHFAQHDSGVVAGGHDWV